MRNIINHTIVYTPYLAFIYGDTNKDDIQGMEVSPFMLNELGQLMLNKGEINRKRLFSEEYYNQSICEYSCGGIPECTPYGLGWWIGKNLEIPYFFASGFGGQYLTIIPRKKMIIRIISDTDRPHLGTKTNSRPSFSNTPVVQLCPQRSKVCSPRKVISWPHPENKSIIEKALQL